MMKYVLPVGAEFRSPGSESSFAYPLESQAFSVQSSPFNGGAPDKQVSFEKILPGIYRRISRRVSNWRYSNDVCERLIVTTVPYYCAKEPKSISQLGDQRHLHCLLAIRGELESCRNLSKAERLA
jgi:hypothetical protein